MRYTYGTIAAVTCAILVLATFWPQPEGPVMPNVVAQSEVVPPAGPSAAAQTVQNSDSLDARNRARIEAILAGPIPEFKIQEMPLQEVLAELTTLTGIKMVFDPEELGDFIDPEVPMTVDMEENSVTYNTLINEYILEPNDLAFQIRHNSLLIMSYDKYLAYPDIQLVVYNCRDLLVGFPFPPSTAALGHAAGGDDGNSLEVENLEGLTRPEPDQETVPDIETREQQLADLIRSTVIHEDFPWADGSNGPDDEQVATIQAYNGLLIIRNLPENHEQVRQLLHLLRESMEQQSWPAALVERESSNIDR